MQLFLLFCLFSTVFKVLYMISMTKNSTAHIQCISAGNRLWTQGTITISDGILLGYATDQCNLHWYLEWSAAPFKFSSAWCRCWPGREQQHIPIQLVCHWADKKIWRGAALLFNFAGICAVIIPAVKPLLTVLGNPIKHSSSTSLSSTLDNCSVYLKEIRKAAPL